MNLVDSSAWLGVNRFPRDTGDLGVLVAIPAPPSWLETPWLSGISNQPNL